MLYSEEKHNKQLYFSLHCDTDLLDHVGLRAWLCLLSYIGPSTISLTLQLHDA